MNTFFATVSIAAVSTSEGFRRRFTAAASKAAAEYAAAQQPRGFKASVIEVDAAEYAAILRGDRNDFVPSH